MTRKEEIEKASIEANSSIAVRAGTRILIECCRLSFQKGAKWADENPKSPWISIKDDLPCNHNELICSKEISEGTETVDVFAMNERGDIWTDYMVYENGEWRWNDFQPDFWMLSPKLPR